MNLVLFTIDDREYGVDIRQVRQVIRMKEIVRVPEAGEAVEGVISLRGKVVPIINLRRKLGGSQEGPKRWNRIVITEIDGHSVGIIVDKVTDVIKLEPGTVSSPDEMLKNASYLTGVARIGNRLVLIADTGMILSGEEKEKIKGVHDKVEVRKRE